MRSLPAWCAAAYLLAPGVAVACSTCMDPREGNRTLLSVTIVLSLLPLALMAAVGGFLYWRSREADRLCTAANSSLLIGNSPTSERP